MNWYQTSPDDALYDPETDPDLRSVVIIDEAATFWCPDCQGSMCDPDGSRCPTCEGTGHK